MKISDLINENGSKETGKEVGETSVPETHGNAAVKTEVTAVSEKRKKAEPSGKFTSVFELLTNNADKLVNAKMLDIKSIVHPDSNIPEDKYLFYVTTGDNAEIVKIDTPALLQILDTTCNEITIHSKGGIVIKGDGHRSYIMKTEVIQFMVDENGFPIKRIKISKTPASGGDPKSFTTTVEEKQFDTPQCLLVGLKKDAITLFNQITHNEKIPQEDLQSLELMKKDAVTFLSTKKEISYLVKIENILLETA